MYVTRPHSMFRENRNELLTPPHVAPNSGFLVIIDEYSVPEDVTCCWGSPTVKNLPFPQNTIIYLPVDSDSTDPSKFLFIPVLDQPLFSNRYYVIIADGTYTGQAYLCPTEENMQSSCFGSYLRDVKPKAFDHRDVHHQVEIRKDERGRFHAKSVSPDGFPPGILRDKGWGAYFSDFYPELNEALGLDSLRRQRLPNFSFPLSKKRSDPVTVGRWYCPFIFIREEGTTSLKRQMRKSMFYEITLEQYWEQISTQTNTGTGEENSVAVDAHVQKEISFVGGEEAMKDDDENGDDGFNWFKSLNANINRKEASVGLSLAIVEAVNWVQAQGGWDRENGSNRIKRIEKNENGSTSWTRFGLYVLVESFVFKRRDKTLVLNWDFKHTHQTKTKWE